MSMDRRYQLVARQIIGLIESGEFSPGSRLPGERELAERLGVSRTTIREAAVALEAQGHIAVKTGAGVYVRPRLPDALSALTEIEAFELTSVRAVVEAESAALAALNMTPAALGDLEETVRVMYGGEAEAADERFHIPSPRAAAARLSSIPCASSGECATKHRMSFRSTATFAKAVSKTGSRNTGRCLTPSAIVTRTRRVWPCGSISAACSKPCWRLGRQKPSSNCVGKRSSIGTALSFQSSIASPECSQGLIGPACRMRHRGGFEGLCCNKQ